MKTLIAIGYSIIILMTCDQLSPAQTCCPAPTGTEKCCSGTITDPANTQVGTQLNFDLTPVAKEIGTATQNYGSINGSGCRWVPGQNLTASIQDITHSDCCNGVVTTLHDITGNISFQLGAFTCSANLLSEELPSWLTSATINFSVSAAINAQNVEWKQTCDSKEVTVTLPGITIGVSGTVEFSMLEDYVKITGGIEGSGIISVSATVPADGKAPSIAPSTATLNADIFESVKLGSVTLAPWQVPIYPAS